MRIAMVGKRGNKLELFNRQAGTSYPHDDTFNKMLQGPPRHLDGWQLVEPPEAVQHLKDGSSLAGHWACLVNPPATQRTSRGVLRHRDKTCLVHRAQCVRSRAHSS